jgi:hypothetical protein
MIEMNFFMNFSLKCYDRLKYMMLFHLLFSIFLILFPLQSLSEGLADNRHSAQKSKKLYTLEKRLEIEIKQQITQDLRAILLNFTQIEPTKERFEFLLKKEAHQSQLVRRSIIANLPQTCKSSECADFFLKVFKESEVSLKIAFINRFTQSTAFNQLPFIIPILDELDVQLKTLFFDSNTQQAQIIRFLLDLEKHSFVRELLLSIEKKKSANQGMASLIENFKCQSIQDRSPKKHESCYTQLNRPFALALKTFFKFLSIKQSRRSYKDIAKKLRTFLDSSNSKVSFLGASILLSLTHQLDMEVLAHLKAQINDHEDSKSLLALTYLLAKSEEVPKDSIQVFRQALTDKYPFHPGTQILNSKKQDNFLSLFAEHSLYWHLLAMAQD